MDNKKKINEEWFFNRIKKLTKENEELKNGVQEMQKIVDAILISIALSCSEEKDGAWELRLEKFNVYRILKNYNLVTKQNEDTGDYILKVTKRPKEEETEK